MEDRRAGIVTAAGKGIGEAVARRLSADGYRLVLMSNSGGAERLAKELDAAGLSGSVTEPDDLGKLVDAALDRFGRIDTVVNNTGHPAKGDLLEISDDDWHRGLDLVLVNVVRMARLVTPAMQSQGGGAIVNVSTFSAFEPSLSFPVSSAATTNLRRVQDGQMTPLPASSSSTNGPVRPRPASLPAAPLARPEHRQRQWTQH